MRSAVRSTRRWPPSSGRARRSEERRVVYREQEAHKVILYIVESRAVYNATGLAPPPARDPRVPEDGADPGTLFCRRAGGPLRLIAYDDAVGCPLDQALAAIEWTST